MGSFSLTGRLKWPVSRLAKPPEGVVSIRPNLNTTANLRDSPNLCRSGEAKTPIRFILSIRCHILLGQESAQSEIIVHTFDFNTTHPSDC